MNDLCIIESKIRCDALGNYFEPINTVFVNNIKDREVLIHECVHSLFKEQNVYLGQFLNMIGLDFNSDNQKVLNNYFIGGTLELVKKIYPLDVQFEEAVAFYIGEAPDELIRKFHIPLLNNILDENYYYYRSNGDMIYKRTGTCYGNEPDIVEIIELTKELLNRG